MLVLTNHWKKNDFRLYSWYWSVKFGKFVIQVINNLGNPVNI